VLAGGRLTKEPIERPYHRCKRCGVAFPDSPSTDEIETHETVARAAMRHGLPATAAALVSNEKVIGRILTKWSAFQSMDHDGGPVPAAMGLKTLTDAGRSRLLVVDADALEVVDLLAAHGELAGWSAARGGRPATVLIDINDPALRLLVSAVFPSATIVVAPVVSVMNVEMAALRELTSIIRDARAAGRNQRIDPRLLRRRAAALDDGDRAEMEWWPESATRLWRAKESILDAFALPKGRERDMLVASAWADLRGGPVTGPLSRLLEAWLDAMLAGADCPWADEAHARAQELLSTARRCKPNAGYGVLRAIIMFESVGCGSDFTLSLDNSRPPFSSRPPRGRRIEAAVESLQALVSDVSVSAPGLIRQSVISG
jgi:hypothetical protein